MKRLREWLVEKIEAETIVDVACAEGQPLGILVAIRPEL